MFEIVDKDVVEIDWLVEAVEVFVADDIVATDGLVEALEVVAADELF